MLLGADQVAEHVVDQRHHALAGAEVGGERQAPPALAEALGRSQEQRDVGPPEAVDRLLGVAHEEEVALAGGDRIPVGAGGGRVGAGDEHGQVDLDGVGVLELVDEEVAVTPVQRGPHRSAVVRIAQRVTRQHQQVVELELAGAAPFRGGVEGEAPQVDGEPVDRLGGDVVEQRAGPRSELPVALLQCSQVIAGPVLLAAPDGRRGHVAQHAEPCVLVARRGEARGPGVERGELAEQQVVLLAAVLALRAGLGDVGQQGGDLAGPVAHLDRLGGGVGVGQVPVLVEGEGDESQVVETHTGCGGQQQGSLHGGIGQELIDEARPAVVEGHGRGHLVEHLDARGDARLDRVLAQDAPGEAVQRADGGAVEVVECGAAPLGPLLVAIGRGLGPLAVEPLAYAVAQLGRGLLGEGDGGQLVKAGGARGDQAHDPVDQRPRLARARPRLHEQGGVQAVRDVVAGLLVRRGGGGCGPAHGRSPSARAA